MSQTLSNITSILKDKYLPALRNQLSVTPSPFLEKIRKEALTNHTIVGGAPVGLNGGFGFASSDASATPKAGAQKYNRFTLESANLFSTIEISDKVVKLGSSNMASIINALDYEVQGAFNAVNWNVGRALFGDGSGKLAEITASVMVANNSTTTITVDDCRLLREGLIIDIYKFSAATGTGTETLGGQFRIDSIDRANKQIVVSVVSAASSVACTTKRTATSEHCTTNAYGFFTVQNSLDNEICGIGAIMGTGNIYGMTSRPDWSKVITIDANNNIDTNGDIILYEGVSQAADYRNTEIDMLLCGAKAFQRYQEYARSKNTVLVPETMEFKGGAVGYTLIVGNKKVVLVKERFVPENEIWGVCTKDWKYVATPLDFCDEQSVPFTLLEGKGVYRALLSQYGNLMCDVPGGCVKFTNCGS